MNGKCEIVGVILFNLLCKRFQRVRNDFLLWKES